MFIRSVTPSILIATMSTGLWCAAQAQDWEITGNAGTSPPQHFLGTTDNAALELRVNNGRALRIEPKASPNLIGGHVGNAADAAATGATIGGGNDGAENRVLGNYGTVSGGLGNTAAGPYASVGGGYANEARGNWSTVAGGSRNTAAGDYSFAAGRQAKANHVGSFVWSDSGSLSNFPSTANNQFLIRASGGVGIGTNSPNEELVVDGGNAAARVAIDSNSPTANAGVSLRRTARPGGPWRPWATGATFASTKTMRVRRGCPSKATARARSASARSSRRDYCT
jgi:hypothetical protein